MNTFKQNPSRALTLVEVFVVVLLVFILWVIINPLNPHGSAISKARSVKCQSNLKIISLNYRVWANDHGKKFPWEVDPTDGGTKGLPIEFQFLILTNELPSPRNLACPADKERTYAKDWQEFTNNPRSHISYFYSPDATTNDFQMITFGDRNVWLQPKIIKLEKINLSAENPFPRWDDTIHREKGNVAHSDGSTSHCRSNKLAEFFWRSITNLGTNNSIRVVYP